MPRIWLPTTNRPVPRPKTERDHLCNELHDLGYLVPGMKITDSSSDYYIEMSQLRDLAQACREKRKIQDDDDAKAGEAVVAAMDPEQITGALKEYLDWKRRKEREAGLRI